MTYPTKQVSFIGYRAEPSPVAPRGKVITCCSDRSVYDPAAGARVVSGPAPQPLATVLLEQDPKTGEFVAGGVAEQTEQVMRNLAALLEAAGSGLDRIVKTTVFLADMNDFAVMNEVYGRYFKENAPVRATVQAARLPRDARVEIEAIALVEKE